MAANFILLDAARMDDNIDMAFELNKENLCLFNGKGQEHLKTVSPYLFKINSNLEFEKWITKIGWGNSWGVFLDTKILIADLYKHLCKLLVIKTDKGESYFRFYDPRVLRSFLPTCDALNLADFFGPIEKFICEDEDPAFALLYSFNGKRLVTERVQADTIFPETKKATSSVALQQTNDDNDNTEIEKKSPRKFFY